MDVKKSGHQNFNNIAATDSLAMNIKFTIMKVPKYVRDDTKNHLRSDGAQAAQIRSGVLLYIFRFRRQLYDIENRTGNSCLVYRCPGSTARTPCFQQT